MLSHWGSPFSPNMGMKTGKTSANETETIGGKLDKDIQWVLLKDQSRMSKNAVLTQNYLLN